MSLIIFTFKKLQAEKDEKFSFHFGSLLRAPKNVRKVSTTYPEILKLYLQNLLKMFL